MNNDGDDLESTEVALVNSIANTNIAKLTVDVGKFTLETVLGDELVNTVPIIGTIVRLYGSYVSIKDRYFLLKVMTFLGEFSSVMEGDRQRFSKDLERDSGTLERAGATLALILDRLDDLEKPKVVGRIYRARLEHRISFDELRRFCMIVDRAYLPDLVALSKLKPGEHVDDLAASYLSALGLVSLTGEDYGTVDGIGAET